MNSQKPARSSVQPAPIRREGNVRIAEVGSRKMSEDPQVKVLKEYQSQAITDPFKDNYAATGGNAQVIEPPYNLAALSRIPRENSMLRQCIDAMVTNVEGHGWRLEYVGPEGGEDTPAALQERADLERLLYYPNPDHNLTEMRERFRRDFETLGNAYLEVSRDAAGRVNMMAHIPGETMRLCWKDPKKVKVKMTVILPGGKVEVRHFNRKFRVFVQRVGNQTVYFKEFGDPRVIDPKTGKENAELKADDAATEVLHRSLYHPGSAYGAPRWINQMPSILGSRQAELTNLDFFQENAVPAMAILVSGGTLTNATLDAIENQMMAVRGREAVNRVVIFESTADTEAAGADGAVQPPRIELKPLSGERQKDGLFLEYDNAASTKIRSSFRLPPIFVGKADDYSHATAKASYQVAESQVFGPERRRSDDVMEVVMSTYGNRFWEFRSNPPRITDPDDIVKALTAFEAMGALTPNVVIGLANEYFDLNIPTVASAWGDWPFTIVKGVAQRGQLIGMEEISKPLPAPVAPVPPSGEPDPDKPQGGAPDGEGTPDGNEGDKDDEGDDGLAPTQKSVEEFRQKLEMYLSVVRSMRAENERVES
jgi:PBSX family phage portal protein